MSREQTEKREQAVRLLRQIGDIDERFVAEALEPGRPEEAASDAGGREAVVQDAGTGKAGASGAGKLKRWSPIALSAAACLAVVLLASRVVPIAPVTQKAAEERVSTLTADDAQMDASAEDEGVPVLQSAAANSDAFADAEEEAAGNMAALANPFTEVQGAEEAEELAGFSLTAPAAQAPWTEEIWRVMAGGMIEVIYEDVKGAEGYRIRKGSEEITTDGDISGDYTDYAEEQTIRLEDGRTVRVRGQKAGEWMQAIWDADGYAYAILAGDRTFSEQEIRELAEAIR